MVNRISGEVKGRAMGIFSVGGNAGFAIGPLLAGLCAYSLGIQSLLIFGVLNALIALSIFLRMPSVLRIVSLAEKKESSAHGKGEKTNDWVSFGKLSVLILARSLGFTLSNTFIPLLWIHVMGASEGEGTSALSILSAWVPALPTWEACWRIGQVSSRSSTPPLSAWCLPISS